MSEITIDIFKGAKVRIQEWGWIQGQEALTENGVAVESSDPKAACFCVMGAIERVGYDLWRADVEDAKTMSAAVQDALETAGEIAGDLLHEWNDHPDRTKEEVVALLDSAIARCAGEAVAN